MDKQSFSANKKIIIAVLIVIVLAIGGFVIFKSNTGKMSGAMVPASQDQAVQSPSDTTQSTDSAMSSNSNVKAFTVTGSSFSFNPSTIKVKKGDSVKITFKNSGGMHDFVLDDFNAKTKIIGSGETYSVQFTADKAGQFEYYCSVANHRAMGMKGTLTVE